MKKENNHKYEIFNLVKKINNSKNNSEKIAYLKNLKNIIEKFINTFTQKEDYSFYYRKQNNKDEEIIPMYYEKMYFYLNYLFTAYSSLLSLEPEEKEEKENIMKNIKKNLNIFSKNHISYCPSLVDIFKNNDNELYVELFILILGFYSQRGLDYLSES